ncbi:protein of unknown function DUF1320, partial [Candidatus Magnetoovum chiemensis]
DSGEAVNDDIINANIASAEAVIDSYIGKLYELPLSEIPAVLTKIAVDITIYYIENRKRTVTPERKDAYDRAIALLIALQSGIATLDGETVTAATLEITSNRRKFTRRALRDW